LILKSDGLYGTTHQGGDMSKCNGAGCGVVFKIDRTGNETVIYKFQGGTEGAIPSGRLIGDPDGNLYGTTQQGMGVVFKLDAAGNETVIHSFSGADGQQPVGGVIRDNEGNLYGATGSGGGAGYGGVVFKLDPSGNETVLHRFTGRKGDGSTPVGPLIRDSDGNLYGTALYGGNSKQCVGGCGVVYKLDPTGQETVLYSFSGGADGASPFTALIRDSAGNLYGTTTKGGSAGLGVVFKLDTAGHLTVLHDFTGGADGGSPNGIVTCGSPGDLYGTAAYGGSNNLGVLFKLTP
jgi:uncharacterized repeat protein (TIGR03803 family)